MNMFGLKTVVAAAALALLGSQAGATTTLICDESTNLQRYLELTWTGSATISCVDAGTDWNENTFPDPLLEYGDDPFPSLADIITNVVEGLSGTNFGSFTFVDPGTFDTYGLLFKFGNNTHVANGWFLLGIDFNGLASFDVSWRAVLRDLSGDCPNGEGVYGGGCTSTQWELSHVSIYGGPPTAVPLPAGGLLLLTALGGMALVRRRKLFAA